jgi:hypothetical protein
VRGKVAAKTLKFKGNRGGVRARHSSTEMTLLGARRHGAQWPHRRRRRLGWGTASGAKGGLFEDCFGFRRDRRDSIGPDWSVAGACILSKSLTVTMAES